MKKCTKCGVKREKDEFHRRNASKDRLKSICMKCDSIKGRIYYEANKSEINSYQKVYGALHRPERKAYRESRKDKTNAYNKVYANNRRKIDIQFKLVCYLRSRLHQALKLNQKSGSAVRDLGCTIPELVIHLEKQFQPEMSWNNHGKWHIDHITPLSSFDLTNREQLLKACHYTNLQPLWAIENIVKSDKLPID